VLYLLTAPYYRTAQKTEFHVAAASETRGPRGRIQLTVLSLGYIISMNEKGKGLGLGRAWGFPGRLTSTHRRLPPLIGHHKICAQVI
jgi:hypothetical protein